MKERLAYIRFLNTSHRPTERTYLFKMGNNEVIADIEENMRFSSQDGFILNSANIPTFTIQTKEGDGYRGTPVVFDRICEEEPQRRDLKTIERIVLCGTTSLNRFGFHKSMFDFSPLKTKGAATMPYTATVPAPKSGKPSFLSRLKLNFGQDASLRLSPYGVAFPVGDGFIAYDKTAAKYVDVTDVVFDIGGMCFSMPADPKTIVAGDYIMHDGEWVRVSATTTDGKFVVEKVSNRETTTILPTVNLFGFNFLTKLTCFGEQIFSGLAANPGDMNAMLPLMMLSGGDTDSILPMLMMMQGGAGSLTSPTVGGMNPMLMMMLMDKGKGDSDMFKTMMLMQMMKPAATPATPTI